MTKLRLGQDAEETNDRSLSTVASASAEGNEVAVPDAPGSAATSADRRTGPQAAADGSAALDMSFISVRTSAGNSYLDAEAAELWRNLESERLGRLLSAGGGFASRGRVLEVAAGLPSVEAPAEELPEYRTRLILSPGSLKLSKGGAAFTPPCVQGDDATTRGVIEGWSSASRARFRNAVASSDWVEWLERPGIPCMLTLTYPGEWLECAPTAADAKRHLRAFKKRWNRRFPEHEMSGIWKQEYQRAPRSAVHFHLFIKRPAVAKLQLQRELAGWWHEIVCSGFERELWDRLSVADASQVPELARRLERLGHHRTKGLSIDEDPTLQARSVSPKHLANYLLKDSGSGSGSSKGYQNVAPQAWLETEPVSNSGLGVLRLRQHRRQGSPVRHVARSLVAPPKFVILEWR